MSFFVLSFVLFVSFTKHICRVMSYDTRQHIWTVYLVHADKYKFQFKHMYFIKWNQMNNLSYRGMSEDS